MRKLLIEELHNLYASSHIIRMINCRRMSCAGHVAHMGVMRNAYTILVRISTGKGYLGRYWRKWKILKWTLEKQDVKVCV
jgi:hypothetical protein